MGHVLYMCRRDSDEVDLVVTGVDSVSERRRGVVCLGSLLWVNFWNGIRGDEKI